MIDADVKLGKNVKIFNRDLVNIFGCSIGDDSFVGPFVEITRNAAIGKKCVIESHAFVCDSVVIEDEVFVGHGAMFVNDLYPLTGQHVQYKKTLVKKKASIGTNATIIGGVTIGAYAVVGAGAVVTKDVPDFAIVAGNPAKVTRSFKSSDDLLAYFRSKQPLA